MTRHQYQTSEFGSLLDVKLRRSIRVHICVLREWCIRMHVREIIGDWNVRIARRFLPGSIRIACLGGWDIYLLCH